MRSTKARRVLALKRTAPKPKPESRLVEKDVYGAEAYTERAERRYFEREGDPYTQYVVPVVNRIGFRPNEERR